MVHSRVEIDTRPAPRLVTCRFWKEVEWLEDHPRHATSLLLMTNPYWASNFDAFEQFGDALTQALQSATESKVEGLGFEGQIQLVFFHPQYVFVSRVVLQPTFFRKDSHRFRDGGERAGADAAVGNSASHLLKHDVVSASTRKTRARKRRPITEDGRRFL